MPKKTIITPISYHIDNNEIELAVKLIIMHTMLSLSKVGHTKIHMGGLLRIVGIDNKKAKAFDNTVIILDENFDNYVKTLTPLGISESNESEKVTMH